MEYRHICVAVALQRYQDITPIALRQREFARALAGVYGASISILSVNAPVETLPRVETTEEKLKRYALPLTEAGLDAATHLREGTPSHEIDDFINQGGIDLLIIGSHSKRGTFDVGLGSTAKALKKDLDITVLMVRPTADEQRRARELMIPLYPVIFPYS